MNKAVRGKATQRLLGSGAFVGVSRSTLFVAADPHDPTKRFLMMGKVNNLPGKTSVEFKMNNVDGRAKIEWGRDYEDVDVNEMLAGKSRHTTKGEKAEIAFREWLDEGVGSKK